MAWPQGAGGDISKEISARASVRVSVQASVRVSAGVSVRVSLGVSVRVCVRAFDYGLVGGVHMRNQPVVCWVGRQGGGPMTQITWRAYYPTLQSQYRCEAGRTRYQL